MCGASTLPLVAICCSLAAGSPPSSLGPRTWTNRSGEFTVQAELLTIGNETVRLLTGDGRVIDVANVDLSKTDHDFIVKAIEDAAVAEDLYAQGIAALNSRIHSAAIEKLRVASDRDARSIKADLVLGIMAICLSVDVVAAQRHFETCRMRWRSREKHLTELQKANYAAALNNLALTLTRQKKTGEAISCWAKAVELQEETPQAIVHNLAIIERVSTLQTRNASPAQIVLSPGLRGQLRKLAGSLKLSRSTRPYQPGIGWLYMNCLKEPPAPDEGKAGKPEQPAVVKIQSDVKQRPLASLCPAGSATGFV